MTALNKQATHEERQLLTTASSVRSSYQVFTPADISHCTTLATPTTAACMWISTVDNFLADPPPKNLQTNGSICKKPRCTIYFEISPTVANLLGQPLLERARHPPSKDSRTYNYRNTHHSPPPRHKNRPRSYSRILDVGEEVSPP